MERRRPIDPELQPSPPPSITQTQRSPLHFSRTIINLLPPPLRPRHTHHRQLTLFLCLLCAGVFVLIFALGSLFSNTHDCTAWIQRQGLPSPTTEAEGGTDVTNLERWGMEPGITLAAHMSADRVQMWKHMADSWNGPMAASVWTKDANDVTVVEELASRITPACFGPSWNSVPHTVTHRARWNALIGDGMGGYPVNAMRNQAISLASTELILLIDADFVPSRGLYEFITQPEVYPVLAERAAAHQHVFVVPMFEYSGMASDVPTDAQSLIKALEAGTAKANYKGESHKGHRATDYAEWVRRSSGVCNPMDMYEVAWERHYEPYVIAWRGDFPVFDERLSTYGLDKAVHAMSLFYSGYSFHVIPCHFLLHMPHGASEWRKNVEEAEEEEHARMKLQQKRVWQKVEVRVHAWNRWRFWLRDVWFCPMIGVGCDWM